MAYCACSLTHACDRCELPLTLWQNFPPAIEMPAAAALGLSRSLNACNTPSGTAPTQRPAQVARCQKRLG